MNAEGSGAAGRSDPAEFLRRAPMGMRVVIRYGLPDGRATDVLGFVSASDETHVVVASTRGLETVALDTVIASKEIPPPPPRRERSAD
ncbi:MAG: hypothetical protein M3Y31_01260 [Gemmatimonadota bacterium]|nr:hypothetical protein [Gemmatimonadota bacterium]